MVRRYAIDDSGVIKMVKRGGAQAGGGWAIRLSILLLHQCEHAVCQNVSFLYVRVFIETNALLNALLNALRLNSRSRRLPSTN